MIVLAAILSTGLAGPAEASGPPGLQDMFREIDRLVLTGRSLQPAFMLDVARLPSPAERMMAIAYLRRAGLLEGPAVLLDRIVFQIPETRLSEDPVAAPEPKGMDR